MIKFTYTLLILIFIIDHSTSQNCSWTISGYLEDKSEKTPLSFAYVFVEEANKGVYSDENGYFLIQDICDGHYHLVISHLGCETVTHFIPVHDHFTQKFFLDHNHFLLEEINVEGASIRQSTGLSKNTVGSDVLIQNTGKPLAALLSEIPGLSSINAGPGLSKPVIHGLYGNRIVILNQGIPHESQQWGLDHAPELDPNNVDLISVIKGASAVRYGMQAMGGVIITEERIKNNDPHWHGNLKTSYQSNGRQPSLYSCFRKAFKNSNIILRGGGQFGGDKKTPDYYLTNTGFRQTSLSATFTKWMNDEASHKLHYSFFGNETGIFRGAHIGNLTDLKEAIARQVPFFSSDDFSYNLVAPRQLVQHHLAKYIFSKKQNNGDQFVFTGGWQFNERKEFDVRRGGRSSTPALHLLLLHQFYDVNWMSTHREVGLQFKHAYNVNVPGTGILPLLPDYQNFQGAAYYIQNWLFKKFKLEWGSRAELRYYNVQDSRLTEEKTSRQYFNVASNLGTRSKIGKIWEYFLDLSVTVRSPEINELYSNGLHQGVAGIEVGNPDMGQETTLKLTHEWAGNIGRNHHVVASVFINYTKNFIFLYPTDELRLTIRGAFPVFKYTSLDAGFAGFSFRSDWEFLPNMKWNNSAHYTHAIDWETRRGLVYIPPFQALSGVSFFLPKTRLYQELNCGVDLQYFGKQNHVDPDLDFAPPPDGYFLTNLFFKLKWKQKNQHDIELVTRFENVFDEKYRNYMNRLRYFADEPGRNIFCTLFITF